MGLQRKETDETSTAILRPKRSPHKLIVDEASSDDNSVGNINPATMETLGLFRGDTILVRGKKRKDTGPSHLLPPREPAAKLDSTVLIVLSSDDVDEGKIQMNKGLR